MVASTDNPIDFALRACESIAFSLHAVLGLTEPCTGCLRRAFGDNGAMPSWFWPVAGVILILIAYFNFSPNGTVVLAVQAYIAAFHMGAVFYHNKLGHHPATGLAPGVFVVFAFGVTTIRTNFWIALLGTAVCAVIAAVLSQILVHPKVVDEREDLLHDYEDDELSPEDRARRYMATASEP